MVGFRSGYRRNPMKHDRIRSYFIGIPVGSASRNPIARNLTTSQMDPIEIFCACQDPTERVSPGQFKINMYFTTKAFSIKIALRTFGF